MMRHPELDSGSPQKKLNVIGRVLTENQKIIISYS